MKFSEKMWLKVKLKVRKKQAFTLSLEDAFLEKPHGVGQIESPHPSLLRVNILEYACIYLNIKTSEYARMCLIEDVEPSLMKYIA